MTDIDGLYGLCKAQKTMFFCSASNSDGWKQVAIDDSSYFHGAYSFHYRYNKSW